MNKLNFENKKKKPQEDHSKRIPNQFKKFCPSCGNNLENRNIQFCPLCGYDLKGILQNNAEEEINSMHISKVKRISADGLEKNYNTNKKKKQKKEAKKKEKKFIIKNAIIIDEKHGNKFEMDVEFADFGDRLVAFLIDSIIVGCIMSLLKYGGLLGDPKTTIGFFEINNILNSNYWKTNWIGFFINFMYLWASEALNSGQTAGKTIIGIKTLHYKDMNMETLYVLDYKQAFIHSLAKVFFLLVDLIIGMIVFKETEEKRGLIRASQRLSKTTVIKLKKNND
ncbi:MAG: RDD family protein [Promethearchaeota archaeon]